MSSWDETEDSAAVRDREPRGLGAGWVLGESGPWSQGGGHTVEKNKRVTYQEFGHWQEAGLGAVPFGNQKIRRSY